MSCAFFLLHLLEEERSPIPTKITQCTVNILLLLREEEPKDFVPFCERFLNGAW